jgi:hypothetical protein
LLAVTPNFWSAEEAFRLAFLLPQQTCVMNCQVFQSKLSQCVRTDVLALALSIFSDEFCRVDFDFSFLGAFLQLFQES